MRNVEAGMVVILALVLCVGCASCGRRAGAHVVDHAPFLRQLGLDDVDKVAFADKMELDGNSMRIALSDAAFKALLGPVARTSAVGSDETPAGCYIVGAKSLDGGYVLINFSLDTGAGSLGFMAVYDSSGKMTDYMNVGSWHYEQPSYRTPQGGYALVERDNIVCRFNGGNAFTLVKENSEYEATAGNVGSEKYHKVADVWTQVREFNYDIDARGHFVPKSVVVKKRVGMTAEQELAYAVDDLGCLPMSDARKWDKMSHMAARLRQREPGKWARDLQPIVRDAYDRNPAELLNWLYTHRATAASLATVLSTIYTDGLKEKSTLLDHIDALPSAAARTYLGNLVDPWTPPSDQ